MEAVSVENSLVARALATAPSGVFINGTWREARGDLPDDARGTTEITHDSMRREYTRQSLDGTGPVRPSTPLQDADPDHAVDLAAHMGQRWSRTLALLAE